MSGRDPAGGLLNRKPGRRGDSPQSRIITMLLAVKKVPKMQRAALIFYVSRLKDAEAERVLEIFGRALPAIERQDYDAVTVVLREEGIPEELIERGRKLLT